MNKSDLESRIVKKPKEEKENLFENQLEINENGILTVYKTKIIPLYCSNYNSHKNHYEPYVEGEIIFSREDITEKQKEKYKINLFSKPKIFKEKVNAKEKKKIWNISINTKLFSWSVIDAFGPTGYVKFGTKSYTTEIPDLLRKTAEEKGIILKDNLIDMLSVPYLNLRKEFSNFASKFKTPLKIDAFPSKYFYE